MLEDSEVLTSMDAMVEERSRGKPDFVVTVVKATA